MKNNFKLAIVGASGVVGQKIIQLLEEMTLDIGEVFFLGSSSVGKDIFFNNEKFKIQDLESFDSSNVDVSIFSAGSSVAKKFAQSFIDSGGYVIDLSSEFRYDDDKLLIIPEVNGNLISNLNKPSIIANPNCSTSQLLMILQPIHKKFEIEFVNIATYQAVSGTGKAAVDELKQQSIDPDNVTPKIYPKQIAFNVLPQCDVFLENAFTKEEMKLVWETKKILDPNIEVQATCARVPVFNGHSEAVFLRTKIDASKEDVIDSLTGIKGVSIIDNPTTQEYPNPIENAHDTKDVYVGRIRSQKVLNETWIALWIVADNVYGKGAALNAVQILDLLITNNKL